MTAATLPSADKIRRFSWGTVACVAAPLYAATLPQGVLPAAPLAPHPVCARHGAHLNGRWWGVGPTYGGFILTRVSVVMGTI